MHRFYRSIRSDEGEEPISGTLELPALGRSMFVGALYDCRSNEVIEPCKENEPDRIKVLEKKGTKINTLRSDSFHDKSLALGLDAPLKISVLVDLVKVDAGAKYIHDRQPLDSQCRITLHIQTTKKLEFVTLGQLAANLEGKTPHVFTQGSATHVVSSALYGSNTFIVLDYYGGDDKENAAKVLEDLVKKIEVHVKEGESTPSVGGDQHVQCRVYSDLTPECDPTNIEGLFTFIASLPELSEKKFVLIKVFVYPLSKIDPRSSRVFSIISNSVTSHVYTFLEGLEDCLTRSHELASDPICKDFPQMQEKLEFFQRLLIEYRSSYKKEIGRLLPLVLDGSNGEGCIKDMFRDVDSSPFNLTSMKAWVQSKRKEMNAIKSYVNFFPDDVEIVNSHETLEGILFDPSIENVVCFSFRLKRIEEDYLRVLSDYIAPERQISSYKDTHWYDNMDLMKEMRLRAKLFSDFFESNKEAGSTKFIETGFKRLQPRSSEEESSRIGGTVFLFEEGVLTQEDFQPPSRPLKPHCDVIDQHSVTLTWTQPKHGVSNIQRYAVKYKTFRGQNEETGEPHEMQTESLETLVTIDNLEPNQSIQFQVSAVCPAGVGPESERSAVATTQSAKAPEKPEFRNVTDSSVILKWRQPRKIGTGEVIASYVIEMMEGAGNLIDKFDTKASQNELKIKTLEPNTDYTFQVVAVYESGINSPPSATSDLCTTRPAGQPGNVTVGDIKSSSVLINWTDPSIVGKGVELNDYFIEYRKEANHQQSTTIESAWEKVVLYENSTAGKCCVIQGLDPNITYVARVTLVCLVDKGKTSVMIPSYISDPFTTLPAGPPINLKAQQISASETKITWTGPTVVGINTELMHYEIAHSTDNDPDGVKTERGDSSCEYIISSVQPGTRYNIKVSGCFGKDGHGEGSMVHIKTRKLIKQDVIKNSKTLEAGCRKTGKPTVFALPMRKVCEKPLSRSYSFGEKPMIGSEHKVIMVVGVTGSGKSTLIDAIVNDILEVEWKDYYRFKVVDCNEGNGSQADSQTQVLTSYTLMDENLNLPYTLTIIDTPGFGDTRGIQKDCAIFEQIREFFLDAESHGIDHIDAIGFVVQASQVRLTHTQKYVFDAILSLFGKDIAGNIILLVTFADVHRPPVLDAVKKAKIPLTGKCFKFNNSALFADTNVRPNLQNGGKTANKSGPGKSDTSLTYWEMGSQSLKDFFQKMQTLAAQSLLLTKEVLEERKCLEVTVQGLQPQIMRGNCEYEALSKEQRILEQHEAQIEANKDFKFTLEVSKSRMVEITGEYITNCSKCHYTCHYPCHIADDAMKARCAAMKDGVCTVCPGKCAWDVHFNQKYKFEYYTEEEEKTYEEIEARYRDASGKKLTVQQVIQKHLESLTTVRTAVFALIATAHKSVTRLEEIALKPNPLSTVEYIDVLIKAEIHSDEPGWQDRVRGLEDVRKHADLIGKVKQEDYNPFAKFEAVSVKDNKKRGWLSFLR